MDNKTTTYMIGIITLGIAIGLLAMSISVLTIPNIPLAIIFFVIAVGFGGFAYHDFKRIRDKEV